MVSVPACRTSPIDSCVSSATRVVSYSRPAESPWTMFLRRALIASPVGDGWRRVATHQAGRGRVSRQARCSQPSGRRWVKVGTCRLSGLGNSSSGGFGGGIICVHIWIAVIISTGVEFHNVQGVWSAVERERPEGALVTYPWRTAGDRIRGAGTSVSMGHWTGRETKMLRAALRLTVNGFSARLGVHPRTVNKWEARQTDISPRPEMQAALDTMLTASSDAERERFLHAAATPHPGADAPIPERDGKTTYSLGSLTLPPVGTESRAHDVAGVIAEFTGSDMASRRDFSELTLLTGPTLVGPLREWSSVEPVHRRSTGAFEIEDLQRAVLLFRQWDASGTAGLHRKAVVGQLNAVVELLRESHTLRTQRGLLHITAELAQLAGWMTFDAGLCAAAQRYYLYALETCALAGENELAAKVVGDLAQLSKFAGYYSDSVDLLHTALNTLPRDADSLVRSELLGHQGCAYAGMGPSHAASAQRSIETAVESFGSSSGDTRRTWNQYMDRAEVHCLASSAYVRMALESTSRAQALEYGGRAEQHAFDALKHRSTEYSRSRVFDEIRLSKVRLVQREPVEAVTVARSAMDQAKGMRSSVAATRLRDVNRLFRRFYGDLREVRDFGAELDTYLWNVTSA